MRIIPKKTRVKIEFFKNLTLADVLIGLAIVLLLIVLLMSNIPFRYRLAIAVFIIVIGVSLYIPFDGYRLYTQFGSGLKFLVYRREFSEGFVGKGNIENIVPFVAIGDNVIDFHDYCAGVVEIMPKEFRLLSGSKQDFLIDKVFAGVIKAVTGTMKASLIKLERPFVLDSYIADEDVKKQKLQKVAESGELSEKELYMRTSVIENRQQILRAINEKDKVYRPCFYMLFYDTDKTAVKEVTRYAVSAFTGNGISAHELNDKELAIFLKYNYTNDVKEDEIDSIQPVDYASWARPHDVSFGIKNTKINGVNTYTYTIKDYPTSVGNAWGYKMFNISDTKVVMNLTPVPQNVAIKRINRSIDEILSQSRNKSRASDMIDQDTHIQTLLSLLTYLQNGNESLYETTIHITMYDRHPEESEGLGGKENIRKRVRRIITEDGFKLTENFAKQFQAFVSASPSRLDSLTEMSRSIHSSSIAAVFPFVLNSVVDEKGILLGSSNDFPVIIDLFKRDLERVNSNMVILGKSGSGKSFSTKTILTNLAAENTKVYILDPENEYSELTKNLGGKMIDVGTAKEGRLNPFQIVTSLDSDEADEGGATSNFSVHLQFLEEFFKQILVGIDSDSLEYLNNLVIRMYERKGINSHTDLSNLTPGDYPTFDDLFYTITEEQKRVEDEYSKRNIRILVNYISKFAGTGRNANLWNGESSITSNENFMVFNFQTLIANKNNTVANAQMLLVLKWLDNEIIKNRDFNIKHNTDRKVVVVIDEAHVFIDTKYPVALDFMYQLAKRIRKYNGMQIIITQNIKDFVGSPEIARKSSAIINACQYSFIFALAPNDMDDLCKLYEKAGEINKLEQEEIVNNPRGNAFVITSPVSRANMEIIASSYVKNMFEYIM
ncbi:MAG: ATP-binding protein [Clostridia bacterium]|nr:ATP-binding protein [Clostridia bacterium]